MKKFIIIVSAVVLLYLAIDYAYYNLGIYIDFGSDKPVEYFVKTDDKQIYMKGDNGEYAPFEIKGINMGSGIPGEWSTDFAIDEQTYKRWFGYMKEMGANTLRIYTVQNDTFYNAFYDYNKDNPDPLYLIHGVWVNDYIQNSHRDAYSKDFYQTFMLHCKMMVDVVHGQRKINLGRMASAGHGSYTKDISPWVIGYILGVEWEDLTVAYTDDLYQGVEGYTSYSGEYMYTTEQASPFEVMLARVGDSTIEYETQRYNTQKIVAFSNWPTTDPFEYPENISNFFMKCAYVDVEHIKTTDKFLTGQFASYHVYPYYPDYLSHIDDWTQFGLYHQVHYLDDKGRINSYRAYLDMLTNHHTIPVVISEFGVSTGRGMAQRDINTGRNQGNTSEKDQGQALIDCYNDIVEAGCAGSCIFTWQDEWFKRTWNTMYAIDLRRTPYWSDYQTNEQYFGLLSFDPGKQESVCYVDGDVSEWSDDDIVARYDDMELSVKYDEKFIYFLVKKDNLDFDNEVLYLPLDITPKTGSNYCGNYSLKFDRDIDFIICLNGRDNSRVQVQERYEAIRSTYSQNVYDYDTYLYGKIPDASSEKFVNIDMVLQTATALIYNDLTATAEVYETGKLLYGNANPQSPDFNSLADFITSGDYIEIKLPWQLLNFADPSRMYVHDDYYENYGVTFIKIKEIYAGLCKQGENDRVKLERVPLKGWGNKVTSHERLKSSYYIMKELWGKKQ